MEGNSSLNAQVAIPRLRRHEQQRVTVPKLPRARTETVNKACLRCRKRSGLRMNPSRDPATKTKCSGIRPSCSTCEKHGDECVYEQPRRDRLRDALYKNETLTALLNDIRSGLDEEHASMVDGTLQQFQDDTPPSSPTLPASSMEKRPRPASNDVNHETQTTLESQESQSVIVNADVDGFDEDLSANQGANSVGYLGRNSQVQWVRTLRRKLEKSQDESLDPSAYREPEEAVPGRAHASLGRLQGTSATQPLEECYFYLDNTPLDELDDVDPDFVPPINTAKQLFKFYQDAVHTPFRILDGQFEDQLRAYYEMLDLGTATNICPRWRAIMNLVFAIGIHYSHLVGATWQTGDHDHHVYMSRAVHLLGFDKITNTAGPPNRSLIQATGLLSLYFLTTGHVNRAWNLIGVSLRHAQAAGFHLENEDPSVVLAEKRHVAQIWWALHSIECIFTSITGRPRIINPQDCTVSLFSGPESLTDGATRVLSTQKTPTSSSATSPSFRSAGESARADVDKCLFAWTRLDVIQHKVLSNLYSVRTVGRPWESIQAQISTLMEELEEWAQDSLVAPDSYASAAKTPRQTRENVLLFFYYQSARICVTRPCLCRLARRLEDRSDGSASPVQAAADACIQAALNIASALPKNVSYRWLYELGPWWSGIHMIMQAITVLLLELTQRTSNLSKDPFYIFACAENLVQWLKALSAVDRVAENAYGLVCDMLRKYKRFTKDPVPEQWLADETADSPDHDADMFAQRSSLTNDFSTQQQFTSQPNLFALQTNQHIYPGGNEGPAPPLSPNFLDDAFGNFLFGQTQYTPYYSSQFTTLFDQELGDESDGAAGGGGWNPPFG